MAAQCEGNVSGIYRLDTDWWSSEDQGLVLTLAINSAITVTALLLYALCATRPFWKRIYSPLKPIDASKHPLLRDSDPCVGKLVKRGSAEEGETLEHTMMQRYFRMIFYIFLQFSVYAFIVLLPLFGANVYLDSNIDPAPPPPPYYPPNAPPLPPQAPDGAFVAHSPSMPPFGGVGPLSGIATLSLSHLPPGSPRFWASSLGMFILTLIFLILARREFEVFIQLRLNWLSEPRPQLYAARLITYKHRPAPLGAGGGAAPRPSGEDMASALKPLFGEGLARCLAVPRHPFWPGLVSKGLAQLDKAGGHIVLASAGGDHLEADPVREAANKGLWEELKMLALGEDFESSYILLFRTRSARFAAMNSNTVLTNAKVGGTILSAKVVPAAAPHDCDWGALSTPRWIIVLAWIGIILFFGFWNVPVALAQSIASVASISRLMSDIGLGAVSEWLLGLSPSATSIIEGYLPSLVLAGLVILAYEIMPVLSRLQVGQ